MTAVSDTARFRGILTALPSWKRKRNENYRGFTGLLTWSDGSSGPFDFVLLQLLLVVAWVVWNTYGSARFDPYPFNFLSAVLALEAVLLTSFVLIRQNAMDQRSEQRNHLDLQINPPGGERGDQHSP